jgi:DNA polymerase
MAATTKHWGAAPFLPDQRTLAALRDAAAGCRGCDLWRDATQTVFGEGSADARVMLVGETPGDYEDREGRPFVGPAGRELDRALAKVGIERDEVYVTNAVKHFKYKLRGKRRIHQRPSAAEITACRPWVLAEIEAVEPEALTVLGAVAARSLLGPKFRVTQHRGQPIESDLAPLVVATIHPSAILRARDKEARQAERQRFVEDLRVVADAIRR